MSVAAEQNAEFWPGLYMTDFLTPDQKCATILYSQLRFINQSHPFRLGFLEGLLGYFLDNDDVLWIGYRWTGFNPNNRFYQESRLIQQYMVTTEPARIHYFLLRNRLEEFKRSDFNSVAIRLRERLGVELSQALFQQAFPYLYDEVFFQLNKTPYTSHQFISENRLFIGFNFYDAKHNWLEIGYINRFQLRTPISPNQMTHILSITYYFFN
jgi:hypothetical protein